MKKFLLFVFAIVAFAACKQAPIEEQSAIRQDAPETLTVGFEGDDTRVQLNKAQKTVWNNGDEVSVFYRSNGNQKWQYKGEDGVRQANLSRVQDATGNTAITKTIVVYPYNETYWLNTDSYCIEATTPATQHYAVDSYGVGDNLMVSQGEFTQLSLKNVYGWLKLQLTGDGETIKSIKFRGNDSEQVAGLIYVDTATAEATLAAEMGNTDDNTAGGNLVFEDTILTEVTLDCGEGVALGKNATTFYIALPPQTFDDGFTVEVACVDGSKMVKSSNKALSIERNHIQPMAEFSYTANISPSNQIWYTSSDGDVVEPYKTNNFGANIVSNTYSDGMGVITFDGNVTTIGDYAFYACRSLTSVNIPDSVTTIGNYAFQSCGSLTSVTIGDSVTTIGDYAFDGCTSLTSVNIPDSVTTIGHGAFRLCSSLTEFTGKFAEDNGRILVVDGVLTAFAPAGITEYNIHDSVTTIGFEAFAYCDSLTSVNIPDSVITIGHYAFAYCDSLTSMNIPDSVTSIGYYAFVCCDSLQEFKGKFATEDGRSLIRGNRIVAYANASGNTYNIPDSVTTIGHGAFCGCNLLTSVNIPDSVTTIGDWAFGSCDSLTSVNIPDSVTTIGDSAFYNCDSLTSVNIPDSVTTIGNDAFYGCNSLTSVYCKATTPPALSGTSVFDYNGSGRKIYVPAGSVNAYKSATNWNEYASAIVGYDFENGVVVEPEQGTTINYTTLYVIDTWAELKQGGKQWNVTFVERNAVLGDVMTVISFYMEKANTLRVEDGTYSVANGGILVNSAVQNGFSIYHSNASLACDITDAEFTVAVNTDANEITINGTFQAGTNIVTLNYTGGIRGMDLTESTGRANKVTEWTSFTGKYWNGYNGDSEFMFQGVSADGSTEVMLDCYAFPKVSDKIAPEGEYTVAPWEAKQNYVDGDKFVMDQSAITHNTIKSNLKSGTVTIKHIAGGYRVSYNVVDTRDREFSGVFEGALTGGTMNNP